MYCLGQILRYKTLPHNSTVLLGGINLKSDKPYLILDASKKYWLDVEELNEQLEPYYRLLGEIDFGRVVKKYGLNNQFSGILDNFIIKDIFNDWWESIKPSLDDEKMICNLVYNTIGDIDTYAERSEKRKHQLKNKDKYIEEYYPYIPKSIEIFSHYLNNCLKKFPYKNFIDVGSGVGDKVLIAKEIFGLKSSGIEYDEYTHRIARKKLKDKDVNLIFGDAFKLSFKPFNLVYLYMPISDTNLMSDLAKHILETMDEGVYLEMLPIYFGKLGDKVRIDNLTNSHPQILLKKDGKISCYDI